MKRIFFKKQEETVTNKSLLNLLKNKAINFLDKSQLSLIKGGEGDLGEEGIVPPLK